MLKAGEVYENPVTGERAVIRIGTDTTGGERLVVDLYVQPGGAVMGEHFHPGMEERFTMLHGQVGFRLAGRMAIAQPGVELIAPPGTPHDWWNAGPEEALVRTEKRPAVRFEAMIRNAFGLAQGWKSEQAGDAKSPATCPLRPGVRRRYAVYPATPDRAGDTIWPADATRAAVRLSRKLS